jgi:hypothetical protein
MWFVKWNANLQKHNEKVYLRTEDECVRPRNFSLNGDDAATGHLNELGRS